MAGQATTKRVHPKAIGDKSEAHVLAALVEKFDTVLLPWGENQRYDFVVEDDAGEFQRIQVKTGRLKAGAVAFRCVSSTYHHPANAGIGKCAQNYVGQVDLFGVWCPETHAVYLVPVEEVGGATKIALRVTPSKNNQVARIRFASTYQVNPPE